MIVKYEIDKLGGMSTIIAKEERISVEKMSYRAMIARTNCSSLIEPVMLTHSVNFHGRNKCITVGIVLYYQPA